MNKIKKYFYMFVLIGMIMLGIFGGFINRSYHKYVQKHPRMYSYNDFNEYLDYPIPMLVLDNLWMRHKYLQYYHVIEMGRDTFLPTELEVTMLNPDYPIYVIDYSYDSMLAKIVSYENTQGVFNGKLLTGWVYAKSLHKHPFKKRK